MLGRLPHPLFFFFNDTATTEIYTLSLHDALPIFHLPAPLAPEDVVQREQRRVGSAPEHSARGVVRSEEHTSELQSLAYLVCRLLLEKKKNTMTPYGRRERMPVGQERCRPLAPCRC